MGLDENRFVGSIDEEFRCSICRDIVEDPVVSQCEHVFCKICINEWLEKELTCPVDRKSLKVYHLCEPSRFFRNFYAKLELRCEFESNGCQSICKIEDLENHQNRCEFNPNLRYLCEKGCNALVTQTEAQSHSCVQFLKTIIDMQNEELLRTRERESEYEKKVLDLQKIIEAKNVEINILKQKLLPSSFQCSEPTASSIALLQARHSIASASGFTFNTKGNKFKLLMIGDSGVGKTSLLLRFVDNTYTDSYVSTINDSRCRIIELRGKIIDLEIWDNCHQWRVRRNFKDADGIMFVYDVMNWKSFKNLNRWLQEVKRLSPSHVNRLIVGNKCDKTENKSVDYLSALDFSKLCGVPFIEVSAKNGTDVEEAFLRVIAGNVRKHSCPRL